MHVLPATVVYIVIPPIAAALSVLAMWRLLRLGGSVHGSGAFCGIVFFLLDGAALHAPGNLFVTRLWQGKIVFLTLLVPLLLGYVLRYVEKPDRRQLVALFAGGTAAVGMSTSGIFLTPLIALAGVAPLARRSPRAAFLGFLAMSAYPLAAGIVTKAVGGHSADNFGAEGIRFDPAVFAPEIFDRGVMAFVAVTALLCAAVTVPHPQGRITLGLLAALLGVTYIPGVTQLSFDVIGLGPTLWRLGSCRSSWPWPSLPSGCWNRWASASDRLGRCS